MYAGTLCVCVCVSLSLSLYAGTLCVCVCVSLSLSLYTGTLCVGLGLCVSECLCKRVSSLALSSFLLSSYLLLESSKRIHFLESLGFSPWNQLKSREFAAADANLPLLMQTLRTL